MVSFVDFKTYVPDIPGSISPKGNFSNRLFFTYLKHQLWYLDRMSVGARSTISVETSRSILRVSNMRLMIGTVKILSIPAAISPISTNPSTKQKTHVGK